MAASMKDAKAALRLLRFLSAGPARVAIAAEGDRELLETEARGCIAVSRDIRRRLLRDGLIAEREGMLAILPAGRSHLKRAAVGDDGYRRQHANWTARCESRRGSNLPSRLNLDESPLATLARLKDKSGRHFLQQREIRAGERLRADFTYGQLAPRLGINWQEPTSSRAAGQAGRAAELTDTVVAARQRVNRALQAVGPELSGVLLDVCCFLKGLGAVESERGWPARSAKLLLKTALAVLARHYEPPRTHGDDRSSILHWGAEGYRPSIT